MIKIGSTRLPPSDSGRTGKAVWFSKPLNRRGAAHGPWLVGLRRSISFNHTDANLSRDTDRQAELPTRVHSSCVPVNASTRCNAGFQLGLGAEIGISTTNVHAFGPMGLESLTAERSLAYGDGHTL